MKSKELILVLESLIQVLKEHEDLDLTMLIKKINAKSTKPSKSKALKKEVIKPKKIDDFNFLTTELESKDKNATISLLEEFSRLDLIKYGESLKIKFSAKDKKDLVIIKIADYFGISNLDAKMSERNNNALKNG